MFQRVRGFHAGHQNNPEVASSWTLCIYQMLSKLQSRFFLNTKYIWLAGQNIRKKRLMERFLSMTSFSRKASNFPLFTAQTGFNQQNKDIFFISIWCEAISHQSKLLTPCVIDTPTKHSHNVWEWWHSPKKHAIRQWRDGGAPGKGGKWLLYSPDATYYLSERPCPGLLVCLFKRRCLRKAANKQNK